jgi:hypothetical protein
LDSPLLVQVIASTLQGCPYNMDHISLSVGTNKLKSWNS